MYCEAYTLAWLIADDEFFTSFQTRFDGNNLLVGAVTENYVQET